MYIVLVVVRGCGCSKQERFKMITFLNLKRAILAQGKDVKDSDEVQIISVEGERFEVLFVTNLHDMYEETKNKGANILLIGQETKKLN